MTVQSINYLKREKNPNEPDIYFVEVQGPASYTSGGFTVSIPGVRTIIGASVVAGGTSAYGLPTVASFTGNSITIKVFSTTGTPMSEIASGTPLTAYVFTLVVLGV
jgi:hypothetical protein